MNSIEQHLQSIQNETDKRNFSTIMANTRKFLEQNVSTTNQNAFENDNYDGQKYTFELALNTVPASYKADFIYMIILDTLLHSEIKLYDLPISLSKIKPSKTGYRAVFEVNMTLNQLLETLPEEFEEFFINRHQERVERREEQIKQSL